MIKHDQIFVDFDAAGALNALVSITAAIDEHFFLTKGGHLVAIFTIAGLDDECRDPIEVAQITRRFGSALRVLGEDCRLYQYVLKRAAGSIPAGQYRDP